MIIETFIEPPIGNNNYLLIDEETKEAVLIDCSHVDNKITETIDKYGATLKAILLTHGHFDHIAGIRNNPDVDVYMHKNDIDRVSEANIYLQMFGCPSITIPTITKYINDGDEIKIGNMIFKVIHTPGHTQGGVCYLIEDKLFSGDTIFRESVGRCDLDGGDSVQLSESIQDKIFTLSNDITIYPGHGKTTSVKWEKEHNCMC